MPSFPLQSSSYLVLLFFVFIFSCSPHFSPFLSLLPLMFLLFLFVFSSFCSTYPSPYPSPPVHKTYWYFYLTFLFTQGFPFIALTFLLLLFIFFPVYFFSSSSPYFSFLLRVLLLLPYISTFVFLHNIVIYPRPRNHS